MERQRADGTRKVEWDQPDSAADGDVEDLGSQLVEEFCAAPPSAYGSSENAAELAEIKNFERTSKTNAAAYIWECASVACAVTNTGPGRSAG
jgi:hypothetical protein